MPEASTDTMTVRIEDGVPWIGDRSFPWASGVDVSDLDSGPGRTWRTRRFRLTREGGWTLSVVFGSGNYCANYDSEHGNKHFREESPDAEIAIWLDGSELLPWDSGDTVKGHVPAADLLRLIDQMMTWPSEVHAGAVLTLDGIREVGHD